MLLSASSEPGTFPVRPRASGLPLRVLSPPGVFFPLHFQIDHVRAEKHGGETMENNLALACTHCNRHKGPNIAGFDAETGQTIRLFNPRSDIWEEHFAVDGPRIVGITAIGRATVGVLEMNKVDRLLVRSALLKEDE